MARKTLIFGNGLGMALDRRHFSLARAMEDVWHDRWAISNVHKDLISECLGGDGEIPQTEDQLDPLHRVVSSCKTLSDISRSQRMDVHWLSEEGQEFPVAVGNYLHKVATDLHLYEGRLPRNFIDPLIDFIRRTGSHVATLNYDKLLYEPFIDSGLLAGYNGVLVDGMLRAGFSEDALERRNGNDFGYYLHLHGSPLFYDDDLGVTRKRDRHELSPLADQGSDHIVLTHVHHKRSVIGASPVLSAYWNYLNFCLAESERIVVFGYSGGDNHLNAVIAAHAQSKHVQVVEWDGVDANMDNRVAYWCRKFKTEDLELVYHRNVLNFTGWNDWE